MDVELPDGTIIEGVPEGTTREQLVARLQAAGRRVPAEWTASSAPSATDRGRDAPGWYRGLASVLQGPSFGFADELGGALGGAASLMTGGEFGEGYKDTRDFMRGAASQEAEDNPVFAAATRMAASLPTMFGPGASNVLSAVPKLGPWLQTTGLGARTAGAGLTGMMYGGIGGAGESTAEDALGVALDAAKGASIGGTTGAAAVPVMAAAGGVTRAAAGAVNESAAAKYAKQKVAEAFARDASNPNTALLLANAKFGRLGPEARAVDVGGQNVKQLLDTTATLPGRTKQAVERAIVERQAGRAGRMIGAAERELNPSGLRLQETVDDLIARRGETAEPLYKALYKTGVFIDDELRGMIAAAERLGAGASAKKIAVAKEIPYALTPETKWAGMRELDYLKQGLDDIVQANTDNMGKVNKVGAAVLDLKRRFVERLDDMTSGRYADARNAFAGPSALIDAAEAGRKSLSLDDQGIKKAMKALTDSEREAYRLGAYEALRAKLGMRAGQTQMMSMWREPAMREKLRELFEDERSFRQFAARVAAERRMTGIEGVGRGSQTAARQYGAGDLDVPAINEALSLGNSVQQGNIPAFLTGAASAWNRVKTPEPVRDEIGRILLSRDRGGLLDMQTLLDQINRSRAQQATALGVGGGLLSVVP